MTPQLLYTLLTTLIALAVGAALGWLLATNRARAASADEIRALSEKQGRNDAEIRIKTQQLERLEDERSTLQGENEDLKVAQARLQEHSEADADKLAWTANAQTHMREAFESLASQSLKTNADQFIGRAKESLMDPLHQNLQTLEQHVRELEQKREGDKGNLTEQLRQLMDVNNALQQQTSHLNGALRSSSVRGRWGELQLRRIADLSGMHEHIDFEEQHATSDANRPDMVVHLPNGGSIPLDSKAPMTAYLEALETTDEQVRQTKLTDHVKAMRGRLRELSQKRYWDDTTGPDFVIMFVPSEACLSAAFSLEPDLMEEALTAKVMVATPMTLLALLKAVATGWQQIRLSDNARQIAEEAHEIHKRLLKFAEHSNKLAKGLTNAVDAHNNMVGSLQGRVLPSIRRLESLSVGEMPVEFSASIEATPRTLQLNEADDAEGEG